MWYAKGAIPFGTGTEGTVPSVPKGLPLSYVLQQYDARLFAGSGEVIGQPAIGHYGMHIPKTAYPKR